MRGSHGRIPEHRSMIVSIAFRCMIGRASMAERTLEWVSAGGGNEAGDLWQTSPPVPARCRPDAGGTGRARWVEYADSQRSRAGRQTIAPRSDDRHAG